MYVLQAPCPGESLFNRNIALTMRLPTELQDIVIDILVRILRLRSPTNIVCKHWRMRCYYHLFSTIHLSTYASLLSFLTFHDIPFSFAGIIAQIHSLTVSQAPESCRERQAPVIRDVLKRVCNLENLTDLSLSSIDIRAIPSHHFLHVSVLKLNNIKFEAPTTIVAFMTAFPQVNTTQFGALDCPWALDCRVSEPRTFSGSCSLTAYLGQDHAKNSISWKRNGLRDPIYYQDFVVMATHSSLQYTNISKTIEVLGSCLRSLLLFPDSSYCSDDPSNDPELSCAKAIHSLTTGSPKRVLTLLPWIPRILSKLPSTSPPTLRVLKIIFASSRQFHLDRPFLRSLALVLMKPQFSALENIHFIGFKEFIDKDSERIVTLLVQEVLDTWYQRGVLRFSFFQTDQS